MPKDAIVVDVKRTTGDFEIGGRVEVVTPFYPATRTLDPHTKALANSLAERIERAINSAILNFETEHSTATTKR